MRIHILARDVSIALDTVDNASFLNILPATVVRLAPDSHPATALVQLAVGPAHILARLTRRSAHRLEIEPGQTVSIQIKAVALVV